MRRRARRKWINSLGLTYLAVFVVTGAFAAVAGTTSIRADDVAVPGTVLWCVALGVAGLMALPPPRMVMLSVAWLISPILMFAAAGGLWSTVLTLRGERVVATVVDVREGDVEGRHLYYTLADQYDRRIPGELGTWPGSSVGASDNPEGAVGQRVVVLRDPKGLVDPRLPEEIATGQGALILGAGGLLLVAVFCMLAGRPLPTTPVHEHPTTTWSAQP
ncbi:DUF3592 domain-containing protein [Micromonospora sp. WMMD1155]|uniref:DUF3592 domain-containing protein n=1 Tax=Micromonospora sp. WMMD1155 TaxID=3016094 RepID=UPI00249BB5A6|nr:DUF3592 domain-containing protein [Micromonospora sp. WMMD1155]WFE52285.1 hypothetical protein O7617_19040 [Micromonospora sp. WMMD1155]